MKCVGDIRDEKIWMVNGIFMKFLLCLNARVRSAGKSKSLWSTYTDLPRRIC